MNLGLEEYKMDVGANDQLGHVVTHLEGCSRSRLAPWVAISVENPLSILQDDLDDWRHEGSKMAYTYSNSFVTLAATKSPNASRGFYPVLGSRGVTRIHKIRDKSGELYTVHSGRPLQHRTFRDAELPVLTRAWAFQERLISLRVVRFADEEVFWECIMRESCECGVSILRPGDGFSKGRSTECLSMDTPLAPVSGKMVLLTPKNRYDIVEYYTTRETLYLKNP
jgi:hypothetical protein